MGKNASLLEPSSKTVESLVSPELSLEEATASVNLNLTENITILSEDISGSIDQISTTLTTFLETSNDLNWTKILFAAFVAFVGAFSAYAFNYFHWKMVEKKQKLTKVSEAMTSLITELERTSVEYWIQDYIKENHLQLQAMEISIKSKLRLVSRYTKIIKPYLKDKDATSNKQKLEDFESDIFDWASGEDFESISRKASKATAMKISNLCSDIKSSIITFR